MASQLFPPTRPQVVQGFFLGGRPRIVIPPQQKGTIQASSRAGCAVPLPATVQLGRPGGGQRLPREVQLKMEASFGTDFSDIRVHVGPEAASIGALAFACGSQLYFAPGQYNPATSHGQRLLGHELAHVVQQRTGRVRNPFGSGIAVVQDPGLEAEAERMSLRATQPQAAQPTIRPQAPAHPLRRPPAAGVTQRALAPPPRPPIHRSAGAPKVVLPCPAPGCDCGPGPSCGGRAKAPQAARPVHLSRMRLVRVRAVQPRRPQGTAGGPRIQARSARPAVALQPSRLPLPGRGWASGRAGVIQRATVSGCTHPDKTVLEIGDDMHAVIQQIYMSDERFASVGPWNLEYEVIIQNGNLAGNANGYCDLLAHRNDGDEDNPDLYILVGEIKPLSRLHQVIDGIEAPGAQRDRYKTALALRHAGSTVGNLNWLPPLDAQILGGEYAGQNLYITTDNVSGIYYYHCTQALKSSAYGKVKVTSKEEQEKISNKESDEEMLDYNPFGNVVISN